jgi:hypothetical protein
LQVKVHHWYQGHWWQKKISTSIACVVDTGGKFATGVNDVGGKFATSVNGASGNLPPVSTTPAAANLPPVLMTPVANKGTIIKLLTTENEFEEKKLSIC